MAMKHPRIIMTLALSMAMPVWAQEQAGAEGPGALAGKSPVAQESARIFSQIEGMKRLPANGLQAVKAGGRMLYVTDNGRFVFQGPVYDLWNRKYLNTLEDVEHYADHVDFKKMGLNVDDIALFSYGEGDKEVVVFLDPFCPYCGKLMKQMPALKDKYRFRLVVVPLLGKRSQQAAKNLSCYEGEQKEEGVRILLEQDGKKLLEAPASKQCDTPTLQRALVTARMLGIYGVPYTVSPDGRTQQGHLADLGVWLAAGGKDLALKGGGK